MISSTCEFNINSSDSGIFYTKTICFYWYYDLCYFEETVYDQPVCVFADV